jgi:adenylyl-sulfate kinase
MKGLTIWLTGLPCSGKSTLANEIAKELLERGMRAELLDGDELRTNLSKGLGFSTEDRITNIRRVGWVCKLLTRNDTIVVCAVIAPYESARRKNREEIGRYMEVYVKAPLETLIERDVKGMYKKALAGEIKNFTGIDDPYEAPSKPEVVVETDRESIEESTLKILKTMEILGFIPSDSIKDITYSAEEEKKIKSRLEDLGYL